MEKGAVHPGIDVPLCMYVPRLSNNAFVPLFAPR